MADNTRRYHDEPTRVEVLTLDDGRRAERHVAVGDNGQEIVEIFAEEKRPLKLEKRIVREYKKVVAKEVHETIKDGEVSAVEVRSTEPDVPLQIRERLAVADHAKIVDGDYVRKEEISDLVSNAVVDGITALMENIHPLLQNKDVAPKEDPPAIFKASSLRAQSIVEQNVADKKQKENNYNGIMIGILVIQVLFFVYGYVFYIM